MRRPRSPNARANARGARALWAFVLLSALGASCRFRPNHPAWVEAFGQALGSKVGAWAGGALCVGTDHQLWRYPGEWGRPWLPEARPQEVRAVTGSQDAFYGLLSDGQVARFSGGWAPYAGSATWGASELSVSEDDHLFVLVGGQVRRVDGVDLKDVGCTSITSVKVAGVGVDDVFLLDATGNLHHATQGRCDHVDAPVRLRSIAASPRRLVGVGVDGSVWRRRDGAWTALPSIAKYRSGRPAYETRGSDVAVSVDSTWLLDDEGAIFVLSDES